MIQTYFEQGSPEWLLARLGRATASSFQSILAKVQYGGESATRRNYRATLVLERLTEEPKEHIKNEFTDWGHDTEELARTMYMARTGNIVEQVGFAQHDELMAGASPDGLISTDGGIEIKCKTSANHLEGLKLGRMPNIHRAQVQGNLWIFEREWWDYVSFDPRFPDNAQLLIDRIYRDEKYISQLISEVTMFLDEVADDVEFVKAYGGAPKIQKPLEMSDLFN